MKSILAALAIALATTPAALGFDRFCMHATGHWGLGTPRATVVSDAYPVPIAITGWGTVLSVSPAENPSPANGRSIVVPGEVFDLILDGDLVYAALDRSGVAILRIDLKGPAVLTPVARIRTPGRALRLALGFDTLAVAGADSGLRLFDVSNPSHPVRTAAIEAFEHISDAAFEGSLLAITDRKVLRVFDVSNPSRSREVSATSGGEALTRIAIRDGTAYAGFAGSVPWGISTGGVLAIDLNDPGRRVPHRPGSRSPASSHSSPTAGA